MNSTRTRTARRRADTPADRPSGRLARRDAEDRTWGFIARRLLIGVALVAIGVAWMILNATVWAPVSTARGRAPAVVRHGPLATTTRTLDGMKVRPELLTTSTTDATDAGGATTTVRVTFHNAAIGARRADFRDLSLRLDGRTFAPLAAGPGLSQARLLAGEQFVTGTVRFAHAPAPGATVVYAPSWAHGHSLRWRLYQ